jgi:leucine dehydrogenase
VVVCVGSVASSGVAAFDLLQEIEDHGAEQVALCADERTGLRAIVAIHSTALGPALGGTRFWPYGSEREALVDVLRLAHGMTYKHAVCGNELGGGKAVIIGDPRTLRTDELIRAYARFVDRLGGRYLTAEDVGTTQADMDLIRTVTPHVTGVSERLGGSGDPSPATAWGLLHAMHAVAERVWGDASLADRHVTISGVGKVGADVARHLARVGARVTVADARADVASAVAAEIGATVVDAELAHTVDCDVFSPCALGAVLNKQTIPELRCAAVCGCANNQLAADEDGERLAERGVLYAPDYVVNAGGVINIAQEAAPGGYDHERAWARITSIHDTLTRVFALADHDNVTPAVAADHLAESRLNTADTSSRPEPQPPR